jgi:pilus assembly protein TadC
MDLVRLLTNPDNLLTAFVAMVAFATIVTLTAPMFRTKGLEDRLKSVANRREELRRRSREEIAKRGASASSSIRQVMAPLCAPVKAGSSTLAETRESRSSISPSPSARPASSAR